MALGKEDYDGLVRESDARLDEAEVALTAQAANVHRIEVQLAEAKSKLEEVKAARDYVNEHNSRLKADQAKAK